MQVLSGVMELQGVPADRPPPPPPPPQLVLLRHPTRLEFRPTV